MNTKKEIKHLLGYIEMKKYVNIYDYNKLLELYERIKYFDIHLLESKSTFEETIEFLLKKLSIFKIEEIGYIIDKDRENLQYKPMFDYIIERYNKMDMNIVYNILCENDIFLKTGEITAKIRYYENKNN